MTDRTPQRARRHTARHGLRAAVLPLLATALMVSACTSGDSPASDVSDATGTPQTTLAVASASFDLAVGEDRRLLLAVFTDQRERVAGGTVTVQLAHLGDEPGGQAALGAPLTATFLPIPGSTSPPPSAALPWWGPTC
jgi:hypothetical protein